MRFIQHLYKFTKQNKQNWFNVLCKYYNGIEVKVIIDGQSFVGEISEDFLTQLPSGEKYELMTFGFGVKYTAIKLMPIFIKPQIGETSENVKKIALLIDDMMAQRLKYGDENRHLFNTYKADDFNQIIASISHLQTKEITQMYIGKSY